MIQIRLARPEDAAALAAIYAPYVRGTSITFEYEAPDAEEFARRIGHIRPDFPYLICEVDGQPAAYAYASRFHERAAFQWDTELSVYVEKRFHRRGLAQALCGCIINLLREQGYFALYALITMPNDSSERLHERLGFHRIAVYPRTGYKLGAWHDMIVMEKRLALRPENPEPPHAFSTLPCELVEKILRDATDAWNAGLHRI